MKEEDKRLKRKSRSVREQQSLMNERWKVTGNRNKRKGRCERLRKMQVRKSKERSTGKVKREKKKVEKEKVD